MRRTRQVTFAGVLLLLVTTGGCALVQRDALDIRPQEGDDAETAAVWQAENAEQLARETSESVLYGFVATPQAADALLADVKGAYETDPLRAVQIAAVTQLTMTPKCERAARGRKVWTEALLRAARASADATRTMFFLDQLRSCGFPSQVAGIVRIPVGFAPITPQMATVPSPLDCASHVQSPSATAIIGKSDNTISSFFIFVFLSN